MTSRSPYDTAPSRAFWSRAVARDFRAADVLAPGTVLLRQGDRVMSAGSCFASNLVPYLEKAGFAYVRAERRPAALRVPPENLGYDNFSAAYGNIYTVRQLLQMLRRAQGQWEPQERVWQDSDGSFIDPFRPGLRYRALSAREFDLLNRQHLDCVLAAFREATVFVFTLGLTEAWVSLADGTVFPACPGTVAGAFDPARHGFHNFRAAEVLADLGAFIDEVRCVNPALRIVLTVSPVPLVASATGKHALDATIYSKSVLRVAAEEATALAANVTYFPAYEIVTGPQAPYDFFGADRRTVSKAAIETVMQGFLANCQVTAAQHVDAAPAAAAVQALSKLIVDAECEEAMADPGARAGRPG